MTNSSTPQVFENVYYRRVKDALVEVSIPDILIQSNQDCFALNSANILYFSKDGDMVKAYLQDKIKHKINLKLDLIWEKISHMRCFKKVSNSLIVNENHIQSVKRNGFKYIFLDNGEELDFDEEKLPSVLLGHFTV